MSGGSLSSSDSNFIRKAAKGGHEEVMISHMAMEKASSQAVKDYARRMVEDHTRANQELMQLAQQKGVTLPDYGMSSSMHSSNTAAHSSNTTSSGGSTTRSSSSSDRSSTSNQTSATSGTGTSGAGSMAGHMSGKMSGEHQKLMRLSGAQFDSAFMRQQVQHHQKDVAEFERMATNSSDSEVRAWAAKTLPTLREHLSQAQTVASNLKNGSSDKSTARKD